MDSGDATVLLIDDESEVRDGIARLLRAVGWKTEVFASAEEFIARLPFAGVGCLVLDVSMPGMTGPELHVRVRESDSTLPVIYLTGRCDIATSVQAMKWGALDVLEKPVDDETLLQAIDAAVERHRRECQRRGVQDSIVFRLGTLSPREREVLDQVMLGRLNKQIADSLGISLKTVKVHRGRAMAKMQVRSVAQLVHMCGQLEMAQSDGLVPGSLPL
jgi:FixJ family two-component response regulator